MIEIYAETFSRVYYGKSVKIHIAVTEMYNTYIALSLTSLCSQVCSCKCDEIGVSARRKAFEESRNAILEGSTFSPFSLSHLHFFLPMWPLRIQPWASAESRRERERWRWLLQRDEATGIGGREMQIENLRPPPRRRVHQQENWGRARIIRAAGDEGTRTVGSLFLPLARPKYVNYIWTPPPATLWHRIAWDITTPGFSCK